MAGPKAERDAPRRGKESDDDTARAPFKCFQCGAEVGPDSERCPQCRSFYVKGLKEADLEELEEAEEFVEAPGADLMGAPGSPVVEFDGDVDMLDLLDASDEPGFVSECSHCGTVVELTTSRCPMCGTPMEHLNVGLLDMFADMEFDPEPFAEADCPYCGEHVTLQSGDCPACGMGVDFKDGPDPTMKVKPVLRVKDVVFLHLDIGTGEIKVLRRDAARQRYDHLSMHLNGADNGGHGKNPRGLSRS